MRENAGHFWPRNIVKILSTLECAWQISWLQEKIWDQIRNTGVGGKRRYHVGVLKQLKRLVRAWCREQDAAFRGHKELRLDDSLLWQWIFNSASIAVWESAGKNRVKWDINMKQLIKMFMSWVQKMMFWLEKKAIGNVWKWAQLFPETSGAVRCCYWNLRAGVAVLMWEVSILKHLIFSAMSISVLVETAQFSQYFQQMNDLLMKYTQISPVVGKFLAHFCMRQNTYAQTYQNISRKFSQNWSVLKGDS